MEMVNFILALVVLVGLSLGIGVFLGILSVSAKMKRIKDETTLVLKIAKSGNDLVTELSKISIAQYEQEIAGLRAQLDAKKSKSRGSHAKKTATEKLQDEK